MRRDSAGRVFDDFIDALATGNGQRLRDGWLTDLTPQQVNLLERVLADSTAWREAYRSLAAAAAARLGRPDEPVPPKWAASKPLQLLLGNYRRTEDGDQATYLVEPVRGRLMFVKGQFVQGRWRLDPSTLDGSQGRGMKGQVDLSVVGRVLRDLADAAKDVERQIDSGAIASIDAARAAFFRRMSLACPQFAFDYQINPEALWGDESRARREIAAQCTDQVLLRRLAEEDEDRFVRYVATAALDDAAALAALAQKTGNQAKIAQIKLCLLDPSLASRVPRLRLQVRASAVSELYVPKGTRGPTANRQGVDGEHLEISVHSGGVRLVNHETRSDFPTEVEQVPQFLEAEVSVPRVLQGVLKSLSPAQRAAIARDARSEQLRMLAESAAEPVWDWSAATTVPAR